MAEKLNELKNGERRAKDDRRNPRVIDRRLKLEIERVIKERRATELKDRRNHSKPSRRKS